MEEELTKHWMEADVIETSLQAIIDKLNIPPRKEDIMQSELDFGKPELEVGDRRKADEGMVSVLVKVKLAMPADFNGNQEKEAHSSIHVASTS